jgi:hypothetical protein
MADPIDAPQRAQFSAFCHNTFPLALRNATGEDAGLECP